MKVSKAKQTKFREEVARLSTGHYYKSVHQWYARLCECLHRHNCKVISECPQVYNQEGRAVIRFQNEDGTETEQVFWTWYRMPSSNWEIICYVT